MSRKMLIQDDPSANELATLDPFYGIKAFFCRLLGKPAPAVPIAGDLDSDSGGAFEAMFSAEIELMQIPEPWYRRLLKPSASSTWSF